MREQNSPVRGSGLLGLRVAVVRDGDAWFAQGLDVDYFAQGSTPEEAETNFTAGLKTMIRLHANEFGHLRYVVPPPASVSQEYAKLKFAKTEKVAFQSANAALVPYRRIQFFVAE